jgi:4-hydroxyacetophenone monooxygenase
MFFHTECQVRYVMQCVRELIEGGHAAMQVRAPVYEEFNRRVDAAHAQMVWAHPGVNNWYKNPAGRVTAVSPWRLVDYWKMTAALDPSHYRFAASVD